MQRPRRWPAAGLLALLLLATAVPAWAETSLGSAGASFKGLPVAGVKVEGAPDGLGEAIAEGLALAGERGFLRRSRAMFFPEILEKDLARCRLFLARRGYPDADVEARLAAVDHGRAVRVRLVVHPGSAVHIREIRTPGLPSEPPPPVLPIRPGDLLHDAAVRESAARLTDALRAAGRAHARVDPSVTRVDSVRADVELAVSAGPVCVVDSVRIEGASPDLVPLVRATIDVEPGDRYSPVKLTAADTGLRELDLFRQIRLRTENEGEDRLVLVCELSARQPRTVSAGVGYLSDELLRVNAEWRHRNQFRAGRGARVTGQASIYLQTLRADVTWPRFAGTSTRGVAGASFRRENEDAYRLLDVRTDFTASRRLGRITRGSAGIAVSWIEVDVFTSDPVLDDPVGLVTSFPLSWIRDSSDDLLTPHRGSLLRLDANVAPPGIGSVAEYARAEARLSVYHPVIGPVVLATRVGGGVARPLGDSPSVLAGQRMFAGGSRSMRGYGRRRLGPKDANGEPVGGEAKMETSAELRFPILGRLEGAAFLDGAQVWEKRDDVSLPDLEWAAGPALMVRSPVGPLRLDWGILFHRVPGEPRSVIHFSVGNPY